MEIQVTEIEPCRLTVHYTADAEKILNKRAEVLQIFKKAPVKGFRPGKASLDAIKIQYKAQIEDALKRALAEDAYHESIFEKKLRPHGMPQFTSVMFADGKFVCEFNLHTKPDFEVQPYDTWEIPKPHEEETVTEVTEKLLQELRVRFGEAVPYSDTDFVQVGDSVIIDYEGSIDGQVVPHMTASGEMFKIGDASSVGFDNNILGMSLNETREFNFTAPEGALASISNKPINFKVTLTMGSKTSPCALDDDLARKLGKSSLEELRMLASGTAANILQNKATNKVNEAVSARLVQEHNFEVPNWMSLSEAQYLANKAKLDWNIMPDEDKEQYLKIAEKNVKLSLILDKIREDKPEAQLSDQEVLDIVRRNLNSTQQSKPVDEVIQEMSKTGYLQVLAVKIKDEHALDTVVKAVKLVE